MSEAGGSAGEAGNGAATLLSVRRSTPATPLPTSIHVPSGTSNLWRPATFPRTKIAGGLPFVTCLGGSTMKLRPALALVLASLAWGLPTALAAEPSQAEGGPNFGPIFDESDGSHPGQRIGFMSAVDTSATPRTLIYEVCNRGTQSQAYHWREKLMLNSALFPQLKGTCDVGTIKGVTAWELRQSTQIDFNDGTVTAPAYLPRPVQNAEGNFVTRMLAGVAKGPQAAVERGRRDATATVEIRVSATKGNDPMLFLKWEQNVGSVVLRLAQQSPAARERLLEAIKARRDKGGAEVKLVGLEEVLRNFEKMSSAERERVQKYIGAGDFVLVSVTEKVGGSLSLALPATGQVRTIKYEPVLVGGRAPSVMMGFMWATVADVD